MSTIEQKWSFGSVLREFLACVCPQEKTPMPPTVSGIWFHHKARAVFALLGTLICFVCARTGDKDSIKEIKLLP